jgi:FkbM family methyltransferase
VPRRQIATNTRLPREYSLAQRSLVEYGDTMDRLLRSRLGYRMLASGVVGYPFILSWRQGWLRSPHGDATATLPDGRLLTCQLDDATQRTMYLGLFDPAETRLIGEILSGGDTFVDVGAHIGWFSTLGSKCVGSTGRVVAFEPYESNISALKVNLRQNDCTNVQVVESALGSQTGTLTVSRPGGDSGAVTALDWSNEGGTEVAVVTLDDVNELPGDVTLMKIDVEGWEPHVLRGARETLSRTTYVIFEINSAAIAKAGSSQEEILELLRSAGFASFLEITEGGLRRFVRSPVSNVLALRSGDGETLGLTRRTSRRLRPLARA